MANFYHVYIRSKKDVTYEQVKAKMDLSVDWFRCTTQVWVLYSTSRIAKWQERLLPLVDPDGNLFICKLDMSESNGWMSQEFWDWIDKNQKKATD